MRTLAFALAAIAPALISASVLPWFPFLRWFPVIALVSVLLVVIRLRQPHILAFAVSTAVLTDALSGIPVGVRAVALFSGVMLIWPMFRVFALHRNMITLLAIAVVLAGAEALAVAVATGGLPPVRWTALLQTLWPAMVWSVVVAVLLHRYVRQRV